MEPVRGTPAADGPEPDAEPPVLHLDECTLAGKVEVFTDGACVHNQSAQLRRAGFGVWWADGHDGNLSAPLEGHAQTNNRAELSAVLHVLKYEPRDVHIKTDSAYVLNGCLKHRFAWAALGWHKVRNADLWREAHDLLLSRGSAVELSKVKGHATSTDVRKGVVSARDKHGNDAADALASSAAQANSLPSHTVANIMHRKRVLKDIQVMMVEILEARSVQMQAQTMVDDGPHSHACSISPSGTSCTESASRDSDSESYVSDSSSYSSSSFSSVQSSLPIHSGKNHPT